MQAILLAGGDGVRLRPLTRVRPKPLVPLANRPLIERLLRQLAAGGVRTATLAIGRAQASAIRERLGEDQRLGLDLRYHLEREPLGSGGAVAAALAVSPVPADAEPSEPVLVCNADVVSRLDVAAFGRAHRASGAEVSIALAEVDDPTSFGVVELESGGRIGRFLEKPAPDAVPPGATGSYWANAGFWLIAPARLAAIEPTRFSRLEETLFPGMAEAGDAIVGLPLAQVAADGLWRDVGTPTSYREAHRALLAGTGLRAEAGAEIDPAARVEGDVDLEAGVVVEAGARLSGPVAAGSGSRIGPDAELRDCLLWDGVRVGAGARLRGCILADGVTVAPGESLHDLVRTTLGPDLPIG